MTKEKAQIVIGNIPIKPEVLDDCYDITEYQEAKAMAIEALEQESITWIVGKDNCQVAVRNMPIDKMLKICAIIGEEERQPCDVLDEIIAEIIDEAEYAYADFDEYKEDILHAEPDELPDDDFRYGLERAVEIINKYKTESEGE